MLKCGSLQLRASCGLVRWGGLSLLEGAGYWKFDHVPVSVWATEIGLGLFLLLFVCFLLLWGVEHKGWEVALVELGNDCDQGEIYK